MKAMNTDTLLHCNHCDQDKPPSEMRKDKTRPGGYRSQCKECKRRKEKSQERARLKEARRPSARQNQRGLPPEQRLFECSKCGRDDVPWAQMSKDKRKFMGVSSVCLECRRGYDRKKRELDMKVDRVPPVTDEARKEAEALGYAFCTRCQTKLRSESLYQVPLDVAKLHPPGSRFCKPCSETVLSSEQRMNSERKAYGLKGSPAQKDLASAARVAALRDLMNEYPAKYQMLYQRHAAALGLKQESRWVTPSV